VKIPREKPCAQKILQVVSSVVDITRSEALHNKIVIEGILILQIVYVAAEHDQPVHHAHIEIPFTTFVDLPGAYPGMNILLRPRVEFVTVQMLPVGVTHHPEVGTRDLLVDAIIEVFVKVTKTVQKHVVIDVIVPQGYRDP